MKSGYHATKTYLIKLNAFLASTRPPSAQKREIDAYRRHNVPVYEVNGQLFSRSSPDKGVRTSLKDKGHSSRKFSPSKF